MLSSIFLVFFFVGLIFSSFRAQARIRQASRERAKNAWPHADQQNKFSVRQTKLNRYIQYSLPMMFILIGCGLMLANIRIKDFKSSMMTEVVRFQTEGILGRQYLRLPSAIEFSLPVYFAMQIPKPGEQAEVVCRANAQGFHAPEDLQENCVLTAWMKLTEAGIMLFFAGFIGLLNLYFRSNLQAKLDRSFEEAKAMQGGDDSGGPGPKGPRPL